MKIYLAGSYSRPYVIEEAVKIFLAGEHTVKNGNMANWAGLYILESYYYARQNLWIVDELLQKSFKDFLLDSGAFTFMQNKKMTVNWDEYVRQYGEFIVKYSIQHFFELDIDSVVGISEVERLRKRLETVVGRKSIPVWHKSRGKDYWLKMCSEYDYVGIGGIVSREITPDRYGFFPWFIETAKERGAKVHALGFTNLEGMTKYPFYSVDSTAWLYGNRGGFLYFFNGKTIIKRPSPPGMKLKSQKAAMHNFNEWVKFANYAERNL